MIKKTILAMMAFAFALCASAQGLGNDNDDEFSSPIVGTTIHKSYVLSVGPTLGFNYSMASDPTGHDLGIGGNVGYAAGLAFNLRFARPVGKPVGTERFGVQLEAKYALHSLSTNYDDNIDLSVVEVPLLFQWYVHPSVYVGVGPTFVCGISSSPDKINPKFSTISTEDTSNPGSITTTTTQQVLSIATGDIKHNDVMLTVGIGYKHKSGFTADVRYNLGNSNLAGNFDTKVSTVSVGIGYLFSIVK